MELIGTDHLKQEVYRLISQSFIHLDDSDRQLMGRFGLRTTQYWALVHLDDAEGRSLSELAHLLICDKSYVTSIVDKLEETGLAERKRGKAGDRRYTPVVVTDQARQLPLAAISAREHLVATRLHALQSQTLHQLHNSLQQLADALQAQFEQNEVDNFIENSIEHSQTPF